MSAMSAPGPRAPEELRKLFAYITDFTNLERGSYLPRIYRLERMLRLLEYFDDPHRALSCIHIAGSKGKGSTAAFIAAVLDTAGYRTGLYTSPHVTQFQERISLAGRFFPEEVYLRAGERIRRVVEEQLRPTLPEAELPSTFELLTLLAFLIFQEQNMEVVVLETGLGGRLDATNVVDPLASVITPIELEHTEYLGDTIFQIAGEKAAILKPGRPGFISRQRPEAEEAFRRRLEEIDNRATWLSRWLRHFESRSTLQGNRIRVEGGGGEIGGPEITLEATLGLLGRVQGENAALAALVTRALFPDISDTLLARGLSRAQLPGRGEILHPEGLPCPVVLDGAHTPESVRALRGTLEEIGARRCVVVFGSVAGKDHERMLEILAPLAGTFIISRPGTFKASNTGELLAAAKRQGRALLRAEAEEAREEATRLAREEKADALVVTGSFYLVGELRPHFV